MQECKLNSLDNIVMLSKVHFKMLHICGNSFVSVQAAMQAFTAAICNNLRFDACLISWLLAALLEPLSVVHMEQHGDSVSQT